jgi:hypothetical protein
VGAHGAYPADRIATAGSCFAQHIGQALARRGAHFLDCEPPPPIFADTEEARRFGYRVLVPLWQCLYRAPDAPARRGSTGPAPPCETVWEREGRFYDALRPGVDPVGQASVQAVRHARRLHLAAVRTMLETLDVMVFTLGLTECWEDLADGTVYPVAPAHWRAVSIRRPMPSATCAMARFWPTWRRSGPCCGRSIRARAC